MDIINGEYPPGVFFKGSQIFGQKKKGSQIFRREFKGSQINFKVCPIFFQIFISLEDTDQTSQNRYNFRNQESGAGKIKK